MSTDGHVQHVHVHHVCQRVFLSTMCLRTTSCPGALGKGQKSLLRLAIVLLVFIIQTDAGPEIPRFPGTVDWSGDGRWWRQGARGEPSFGAEIRLGVGSSRKGSRQFGLFWGTLGGSKTYPSNAGDGSERNLEVRVRQHELHHQNEPRTEEERRNPRDLMSTKGSFCHKNSDSSPSKTHSCQRSQFVVTTAQVTASS